MIFYTGGRRSADSILKQQVFNIENNKIDVNLTYELYGQLQDNNIDNIGNILHQGWQIKKKLSADISNEYINNIYDKAIAAGAEGGKLLGVGASRFILIYANKNRHTSIRNALGLFEVEFNIDTQGTIIIYRND